MEVEWCVAKIVFLAVFFSCSAGKMTGQPWQGGKLRVQRSRPAKQAVVPFPTFCPPDPTLQLGPPPPSLGTSRCQPWCQLQIPPNPPPQHGNVDFEAKEHTFKSISSFTFSEGGLYELFQNPRIANGTNALWAKLLRKWEIGKFTKITSSPLIFWKLYYFRWTIFAVGVWSVSLSIYIWLFMSNSTN